MNLGTDFVTTARRQPDAAFVVDRDDTVVTYVAMFRRAGAVAAWLAESGVTAGDRVVISLPGTADYLAAYLGVLFTGAIAVPVDPRVPAEHLAVIRRETGAACWLSGPEDQRPVPDRWLLPRDLDRRPFRNPAPVAESADALILFTSGTTGTPKGVRLTHANLRHTVRSIASWAKVGTGERELALLPLTHLFGLAHVHLHWTLGGSVVLEDGLRDPLRALQRLRRHGVTALALTPSAVRILLEACPREFAESVRDVRYAIINSAPLPETDVRRLLELAPTVRWHMYYGLTEASRSTAIHYNVNRERLGSVGRPTPGTELRLGEPGTAETDGPAEIFVRGPHVSPGYWGAGPARPRPEGGWIATGDLGTRDSAGFVTWVGRLREQINVGGLKVAPPEVEAILAEHPAVLDCAVVPSPHDTTGEMVVGCVVTRVPPTPDLERELRRFCRDRLEPHKVPRRIRFVPSIPRTEAGKVQRLALRELAAG